MFWLSLPTWLRQFNCFQMRVHSDANKFCWFYIAPHREKQGFYHNLKWLLWLDSKQSYNLWLEYIQFLTIFNDLDYILLSSAALHAYQQSERKIFTNLHIQYAEHKAENHMQLKCLWCVYFESSFFVQTINGLSATSDLESDVWNTRAEFSRSLTACVLTLLKRKNIVYF
jgi:hypothetical protein